jgi:hypothetical protein
MPPPATTPCGGAIHSWHQVGDCQRTRVEGRQDLLTALPAVVEQRSDIDVRLFYIGPVGRQVTQVLRTVEQLVQTGQVFPDVAVRVKGFAGHAARSVIGSYIGPVVSLQ